MGNVLKRYNGADWEAVGGKITGDTLPIGSEVDYVGDSVPAGWEEVDSYSTSEVNTGETWIDGKPIYRKIYANNSYSQNASTTADVSFSLPNLDMITAIYGSAKVNDVCYPVPNSMWANTSGGMQYSWNINAITSSGFKILTGSGSPISNFKICIVFEYTKTTD